MARRNSSPSSLSPATGRTLMRACRCQGAFQRGIRDARDIARDLLQGPIPDDVVGADAQDLPLAEAAKSSQHGRVLEGRIDFTLKLFLHLLLTGATSQRHAQHVE